MDKGTGIALVVGLSLLLWSRSKKAASVALVDPAVFIGGTPLGGAQFSDAQIAIADSAALKATEEALAAGATELSAAVTGAIAQSNSLSAPAKPAPLLPTVSISVSGIPASVNLSLVDLPKYGGGMYVFSIPINIILEASAAMYVGDINASFAINSPDWLAQSYSAGTLELAAGQNIIELEISAAMPRSISLYSVPGTYNYTLNIFVGPISKTFTGQIYIDI
jgi:hypothetical protein